ncbi:uncharacterized protein sb:cb288 [Electrophorus electricus]|uniref:uncharacterized protein sb:cb288 n=1 Tax=Electrophorus electricus TaxID=8005 RepID=UPI0015D08E88|nr:uncharacterized protein sb:cb288 [Electrophorus electricus]
MWPEVRNGTVLELGEGNESQVVVPAPVWLPLTSLRNGSMVASPSPLTETPLHKRSGIIPGLIAAALFITFLLALYTVLWKCMVSPATKRGKRTRGLKSVRRAV